MADGDIEERLDEDFLFILNFSKDYIRDYADKPEMKTRFGQWLRKLSYDQFVGINAKRMRNTYLVRLMSCMHAAVLSPPFNSPPEVGPLPPIEGVPVGDVEPPWLQELVEEAKRNRDLQSQAKDARTYLGTKIFEANKGACAYLAVSVADEGKLPTWVRMGGNENFQAHLDRLFYRISTPEDPVVKPPPKINDADIIKLDKELAEYIVDSIAMEVTGIARSGAVPIVNQVLERFQEYIRTTPLQDEAETLSGEPLRRFLLIHLQSQLINSIQLGDLG